jgi:HTH-type transcriptional regulator/antitoxin HipB
LSNKIGAIVREARRAKKISQEDLAERVGVAAQSLSKIEQGHRVPTLQTMLAIMRELQISPQVLTPFVRVSVSDHRASLEAELLLTAGSLSDDEIKLAIAQLRTLAAHSKSKRS